MTQPDGQDRSHAPSTPGSDLQLRGQHGATAKGQIESTSSRYTTADSNHRHAPSKTLIHHSPTSRPYEEPTVSSSPSPYSLPSTPTPSSPSTQDATTFVCAQQTHRPHAVYLTDPPYAASVGALSVTDKLPRITWLPRRREGWSAYRGRRRGCHGSRTEVARDGPQRIGREDGEVGQDEGEGIAEVEGKEAGEDVVRVTCAVCGSTIEKSRCESQTIGCPDIGRAESARLRTRAGVSSMIPFVDARAATRDVIQTQEEVDGLSIRGRRDAVARLLTSRALSAGI